MDVIRRSGVDAKLPGDQAGLAVALGGIGVTLNDLVQLYAMLAQGGKARPLYWNADRPVGNAQHQIVSRSAAWQVADILAGSTPPNGAPSGRMAYKTGTSYGHRDAWAIGFDGAHVAGVWIGRADGTPVPGAFGGDLAAPMHRRETALTGISEGFSKISVIDATGLSARVTVYVDRD
jgi:penicillin-binding protein 1C